MSFLSHNQTQFYSNHISFHIIYQYKPPPQEEEHLPPERCGELKALLEHQGPGAGGRIPVMYAVHM